MVLCTVHERQELAGLVKDFSCAWECVRASLINYGQQIVAYFCCCQTFVALIIAQRVRLSNWCLDLIIKLVTHAVFPDTVLG